MLVGNLRASRKKAVVIFTEFTRLYKQNKSALYCFFEGEDSQYYGIRIRNITKYDKNQYFRCNGKEGVLGIYRLLSSRQYYANARTAYFVDRDFDPSIYDMGLHKIYETPCYSVENFYTSIECFSEILKSEFKLTELDEDFVRCQSLYRERQEDFHNAVELLNAWIACHRRQSNPLNLSDLKLSNLIKISLEQVNVNYTIDSLSQRFPDLPVISNEELEAEKSLLRSQTRQKSFRGKFEIEFLFRFLTQLIQEANQQNSRYFTSKAKVNLLLRQKTIISDLSQYADTPSCLRSYLESL